MSGNIEVYYESTPNPQSMKFVITKTISEESINFETAASAGRSPLALKIFGFPWAEGVYIGPHFVTVTKQEWVDWEILADPLSQLIQEHIQNDEVVLNPSADTANLVDDSNDSNEVKTIKTIINNEIRPAVAMDGGDIVFHKYEDNIVHVFMQGACAGCPSSTLTLKQGIEARLQQALPEIKEVVAVM
ncbi:MAG: hypothetical protein CL677_06445 [Bdellovibrionaceae bacterium]|nr:hypothetical protein [Pseudobdellovibrionaceae bacterium]|tara:strand:- start:182 stop:745 length:564 start_codon:yes stop_codon:yes gene_type:complete